MAYQEKGDTADPRQEVSCMVLSTLPSEGMDDSEQQVMYVTRSTAHDSQNVGLLCVYECGLNAEESAGNMVVKESNIQ